MNTAAEIINRFGGITALANKLETTVPVVGNWSNRKKIPSEWWGAIINLAAPDDVDEVTNALINHHTREKTRNVAGKRNLKRAGDVESPPAGL